MRQIRVVQGLFVVDFALAYRLLIHWTVDPDERDRPEVSKRCSRSLQEAIAANGRS